MKWYRSVKRIMDRAGERVYLTRYFIFGHTYSTWALMVHQMHRPDDDACHHDHPWSFFTLILRGGYVEEVTNRRTGKVYMRRNRPGMLLWRPAAHRHRIHKLADGGCWTLVLRFRRKQSWGFWTKEGWIHWERFIQDRVRKGVAWCESLLPEEPT